jgi:hypothetical protein
MRNISEEGICVMNRYWVKVGKVTPNPIAVEAEPIGPILKLRKGLPGNEGLHQITQTYTFPEDVSFTNLIGS